MIALDPFLPLADHAARTVGRATLNKPLRGVIRVKYRGVKFLLIHPFRTFIED